MISLPILIILIIFVILLVLPLSLSVFSIDKSDKHSDLLIINPSKSNDGRYFALSFANKMEEALSAYNGSGVIHLSKDETLIEADNFYDFSEICESIIYAKEKDFRPKAGITFEKEIYACNDVYLYDIPLLRAVYSKKNIIIGSNTVVSRWTDAEISITVHDHCNLGVSATSANYLHIGKDCYFHRLYAPFVTLDCNNTEELIKEVLHDTPKKILINDNILRDVKNIHEEHTGDSKILDSTIISKHPVEILEGITVHGHVRSLKSVTLYDNVTIHGNVFSEEDIYIGQNTIIYGNVFSQKNIILEIGSQIGQYGGIKSIIARKNITFAGNCKVFGYVRSEDGASCCADIDMQHLDDDETKEYISSNIPPKDFIHTLPYGDVIKFGNYTEFDNLHLELYRKNIFIKSIIIPEGVRLIPPSFFYFCTNLEQVTLPSTLEEIGDYAFNGCSKLDHIDLSHCSKLLTIGELAFNDCSSLSFIELPEALTLVKNGAFSNCISLKKVIYHLKSNITDIMPHTFLNCSALAEIHFPPKLETIKFSGLNGCSALEVLNFPVNFTNIENFVFGNCSNLKTFNLTSTNLHLDPKSTLGLCQRLKEKLENLQQ